VHLSLTLSWVEVLCAVGHSADAQWLQTLDAQASAIVIGKLKPAYIGLITRLLRAYIGVELLVGRLLVATQERGLVAVGVVLPGTPTIVYKALALLAKYHTHTEAW
jgi:hypothetical protein